MSSLAGSFLVARPVLADPSFRRTVVLILQHGPEGAFGLVVNRSIPVEGLPFPVYAGGPCLSEGLLMLHGHEEWLDATEERPKRALAPGIYLGDVSCVSHVSEAEAGQVLRYRMFTGYSGWGPKQLEGELIEGVWAVTPARGSLLFDTPIEELWHRLLPPTIPEPSVN